MVDEKRNKSYQDIKNEVSLNWNTEPDRVASHFKLTPPSFLEPI